MALPKSKIPVILFPLKIETRFVADELWIRAFPDQAFLQSHDPRLTKNERDDAKDFKDQKITWEELVSKYGVYRSAWLVQITEVDLDNQEREALNKGEKAENKAPDFCFKWLPNKLVAYLYKKGDSQPSYMQEGAEINRKEDLTVFGEGDDWLEDFAKAVKIGMGLKIKLNRNSDTEFEKVIVTGIRYPEDEKDAIYPKNHLDQARGLVELFHNHQYTEGFSFLKYGTPTNNTEKEKSGHSAREEYNVADSYDYAAKGLDLAINTNNNNDLEKVPSFTAGCYLANNLGLETDDFKHIKQADLIEPKLNSLFQKASWFALGAEPIFMLFGDQISSETHELIWQHYSRYVKARGLYTPIKIGNQPYGILPVTSIRNILNKKVDIMSSGSFFDKMSLLLARLFEQWLEMVDLDINGNPNIPRLGDEEDTYEEILKILSMHENSSSYQIRALAYSHFRRRLQNWLRQIQVDDASLDTLLESLPTLLKDEYDSIKENLDLLKQLLEGFPFDEERLLLAPLMSFKDGDAPLMQFKDDEIKFIDEQGKEVSRDRKGEEETPFAFVQEDLSSFEKFIEYLEEGDADSLFQYTGELSLFTDLFLSAYINASQLYYREICFEPTIDDLKGYELPSKGLKFFTIENLSITEREEVKKGQLALEVIGKIQKETGKPKRIAIKEPFAGRIEKIHVKKNDNVIPGMALFRLKNEKKRDEIKEQFKFLGRHIITECQKIPDPIERKQAQQAALRESLDLNSYRLDAWITSLAARRLEELRNSSGYEKGIYFGVYGWVEQLSKNTYNPIDVNLTDTYKEAGGIIHAPSPAQAVASAIFKNSFLAHHEVSFTLTLQILQNLQLEGLPGGIIGKLKDSIAGKQYLEFNSEAEVTTFLESTIGLEQTSIYKSLILQHTYATEGNPFILNLTSDRIQKSHFLLEGIRQGQEIEALLGYQLERYLHEGELDIAIALLRKAFPLDENNGLVNKADSTIDNLTVIDGLKAINNKENLADLLDNKLSEEQQNQIKVYIEKLADNLDGSLDTLFYEAGYHITQGNISQAAAAMDATKGAGEPPITDALKTKIPGVGISHKFALIFPEPKLQSENNYKGFVEPVLETWLENNIGDFDKIGCQVELYSLEDKSLIDTVSVKLGDLEIGYLDFLYLSDDPVSYGASELELRIWNYVCKQKTTAGQETSYTITDTAPPGCQPLAQALEVARYTYTFLSKCRFLKSEDVTMAEEEVIYSRDALESIKNKRLVPVLAKLNKLKSADLKDIKIVSNLAKFDIQEARASLIEKVKVDEERLKQAINQKIVLVGQHLRKYNRNLPFDKGFEHLSNAAKALFGKPFILIPPAFGSDKFSQVIESDEQHLLIGDKSANSGNQVWGQERIQNWVQGVAQVQENTEAFEDWQMVNKVWADSMSLKQENFYYIVQGPTMLQYPWIGLSKKEIKFLLDEYYPSGEIYKLPETEKTYGSDDNGYYPDGCESMVIYATQDFTERVWEKTPIYGLLIDEFAEHIPDEKINTGLSFHYNAPNSEPPQAILLAVHPQPMAESHWSENHLRDILYETMDLYKIRMVDPEAIQNYGFVLPMAYWMNIPR